MARNAPPPSEAPPGQRAVTMETVGRLAGVSQVTVSRALNDPKKVSPETLRKIQEAIAVTGYVPNALAGALASRRSKLVAALVPSLTNVVYSSMIKSLSDTMRDGHYQIMLSETGTDPAQEEELIATHLSRRPDAIVLTGIHHTANARRMLLGAGIPVVELWDITDSPIDLCVGFSHSETGRAAARYALDRGYDAAAAISAGDERALRRMSGFADLWTERTGQSVPSEVFAPSSTLADGRTGLARLVDTHGLRRGVIHCSSDVLAHGVLTEAAARGLRVPEDIAVIGFGDQDMAAHTYPALTTVRVDRSELGLQAAKAILARFEGKDIPPVTDLSFSIIARDSA
ncbi:LacI family DNA-binding transcriptional regulator [Tranquillimonas rosea]|uniref:LacI family DNA-binding transcriptional regulator n=1 Tax=Tranquillimonas rosea TaxID=641238 RepID=UPI001F3B78C6|nr:LacI family DNA-binding transcriptional regulator [Tranquillimonas rosea]